MDLAGSYRACARLTRREARNFHFAFLSLPRRQRLAVYALYAFCRAADDVVDRERSDGSKRRALARLRERLAKAASGAPQGGADLALADAIHAFGVDPNDLADVLDGMEMDLTLRRVETFDELEAYAYRVASAVGLATLPILNDGIPPTEAMREAAIDLGIGMQLVNVLRDVAEDLERDRIYLPRDEMEAFGVDADALRGPPTGAVRALLAHQADRAADRLTGGRGLLPLLPPSGRRCPQLLAEIYGRILARIRTAGYDVFAERVGLPTREKVALLISTLWRRP